MVAGKIYLLAVILALLTKLWIYSVGNKNTLRPVRRKIVSALYTDANKNARHEHLYVYFCSFLTKQTAHY